MYTPAGVVDEIQGWARAGDSTRTAQEIAAFSQGWDWFKLGDLDLVTHLIRANLLRPGSTLSDVTEVLCNRWSIPRPPDQRAYQPPAEVLNCSRPAEAGNPTHDGRAPSAPRNVAQAASGPSLRG